MPLTIPDYVLDEVRRHSPQTLIDLACRLYTADELAKNDAIRLTGLTRSEFESELTRRGLPWIRVAYDETYEHEFAGLHRKVSSQAGRDG